MGWNVSVFTQVLVAGDAGDGLFLYDGTPGSGNLIGSWAAQAGADSFGNSFPAGLSIDMDGSAGGILQVTDTSLAPTSPIVQLVAAAMSNKTFGIQVAGDTFNRFRILSDGEMAWGPGNLTQDVFLQRLAAGGLYGPELTATDPVNGGPETWHTVPMENSWTGTLQYQLTAAPPNHVEVACQSLSPGTLADGTTIATLPSAYWPQSNQWDVYRTDALKVSPVSGSAFESCALRLDTSGNLACFGVGTAATAFSGTGFFALDR